MTPEEAADKLEAALKADETDEDASVKALCEAKEAMEAIRAWPQEWTQRAVDMSFEEDGHIHNPAFRRCARAFNSMFRKFGHWLDERHEPGWVDKMKARFGL